MLQNILQIIVVDGLPNSRLGIGVGPIVCHRPGREGREHHRSEKKRAEADNLS